MNMDLWNSLEPELQDILQNKILPEMATWWAIEQPAAVEKAMADLEEEGFNLRYIDPDERREFRNLTWNTAKESGLLDELDVEFLKLADALRNEPYDQTEMDFSGLE
jgi:TRAP-type C4-dicarboxylate transport system substrate-binding protein